MMEINLKNKVKKQKELGLNFHDDKLSDFLYTFIF